MKEFSAPGTDLVLLNAGYLTLLAVGVFLVWRGVAPPPIHA
jgi:hypothetical protein